MDLVQGVYQWNAEGDANGFPVPQSDATKGKTIIVIVCDDVALTAKYNAALAANPASKPAQAKLFEAGINRQGLDLLRRVDTQNLPPPVLPTPVVFADNVP